jgi:beta-galactosidase/beta-glucuronidase
VDPEEVLPEYPRPMMERKEWKNLNGLWQFQKANEGDQVPFGKKLKRHILVPFPWESALSGIREQFDSRRAWYRRTFSIPESWTGERILLHFGAVDWEATVYVNGRCVGTHRGGYDAFSFDITHFLETKGEQELILHVWDPGNDKAIAVGKQNNGKFDDPSGYSYCPASGIWQTVWMEPVPERYIQDFHLTPDIDRELVTVLVNTPKIYSGLLARAEILKDGRVLASGEGRINKDFFVPLSDPRLWSPDDPYLYEVRLSLVDCIRPVDSVESYVGMRKISIEDELGLKRIYLNNKFLFQMGPLDQGYWPDGIYTAPTDEALKWEIEMMKEFGYNMVRKHIKVEPQRWFYWCDKLGLLVYQDMPSTFKRRTEEEEAQFELELDRMVRSHWNHPSIVNWIVFNEHWGYYDVVRLTENVMALDPSRLVTGNSGIDAGKPDIDWDVGHIIDNHSYRPPNSPFASQKRASVCGEYGAIGYNIEGHIWDTDGPWVHYNYEGKEAATAEYETFIGQILGFQENGLSAAVYTQWTDLENEMNGIYTYDRKVIKLDKERVTRANRSTWETYIEMPTKNY